MRGRGGTCAGNASTSELNFTQVSGFVCIRIYLHETHSGFKFSLCNDSVLPSPTKTMIDSPHTHRIFIEFRSEDCTLWVEKLSNRRGCLAQMNRLDSDGSKGRIMREKRAKNYYPLVREKKIKTFFAEGKSNMSLDNSFQQCGLLTCTYPVFSKNAAHKMQA